MQLAPRALELPTLRLLQTSGLRGLALPLPALTTHLDLLHALNKTPSDLRTATNEDALQRHGAKFNSMVRGVSRCGPRFCEINERTGCARKRLLMGCNALMCIEYVCLYPTSYAACVNMH